MKRRIAVLSLAVATLLGTTACTGVPPPASSSAASEAFGPDGSGDAGQSLSDACGLVQGSIEAATSAFEGASDDPASAARALQAASEELAGLASHVTNDEIAALLQPLQDMFGKAAEAIEALSTGDVTRLAEIDEVAASFQETSVRYQQLCLGA